MAWILSTLMLAGSLIAEHRVFELRIVNEKTNKERKVYTTLDWLQYHQYHHLSRDERVELVDHWMCWKRANGLKPLCKRPVTADTLKSENQPPEG